jgi:hypothetical protein
MKLNINPKELLALHNLLYERLEGDDDCKAGDEPSDETNLRELYKRIRSCIIGALANKGVVDPLDGWLHGQQQKIDELKEANASTHQEVQSLKEQFKDQAPVVLSADDADMPVDYPRKAPKPQMPRSGKFHGHRK